MLSFIPRPHPHRNAPPFGHADVEHKLRPRAKRAVLFRVFDSFERAHAQHLLRFELELLLERLRPRRELLSFLGFGRRERCFPLLVLPSELRLARFRLGHERFLLGLGLCDGGLRLFHLLRAAKTRGGTINRARFRSPNRSLILSTHLPSATLASSTNCDHARNARLSDFFMIRPSVRVHSATLASRSNSRLSSAFSASAALDMAACTSSTCFACSAF